MHSSMFAAFFFRVVFGAYFGMASRNFDVHPEIGAYASRHLIL